MWLKLIKATRDYFSISHKEARGALILFIISFAVILTTYIIRTSSSGHPIKLTTHSIPEEITAQVIPSVIINLRSFNPNSENELTTLGIPIFLCERIENYRIKGGVFKIKSDLSKIYDFPDSLYKRLEPYIDLPTTLVKSSPSIKTSKNNHPKPIIEETPIILDIARKYCTKDRKSVV